MRGICICILQYIFSFLLLFLFPFFWFLFLIFFIIILSFHSNAYSSTFRRILYFFFFAKVKEILKEKRFFERKILKDSPVNKNYFCVYSENLFSFILIISSIVYSFSPTGL